MKREIKFRAWDEGNKVMHFDFQFVKTGDDGNDWILFTSDKQPKFPINEWSANPYFSQQLKIMQFTGLKDKNGKEIYEGDIIIQYPGFGCMFSPRKGVVNYRDASFWFDLTTIAFVLEDHDCSLEVIGNIYEDGHLLDNGE